MSTSLTISEKLDALKSLGNKLKALDLKYVELLRLKPKLTKAQIKDVNRMYKRYFGAEK